MRFSSGRVSMKTSELLAKLNAAGVRLSLADSGLSISAPTGALTPELQAAIASRKVELLELLADSSIAKQQTIDIARRTDRDQPAPLSFAQQRIWFLEVFGGSSALYNIPKAFRIRGAFKAEALQGAVDTLVARHESLRTAIREVDEQPMQVVLARRPVKVRFEDMSDAADDSIRTQVENCVTETFDLAHDPLLRIALIRVAADEHILIFVLHHIIADGWSLDVMQNQLLDEYQNQCAGNPSDSGEMPLQLADYAVWQRGRADSPEFERQLEYWETQLGDAPDLLELPLDKPRPKEQSYRGARCRHQLSASLSRSLEKLAIEHNATLFMTLLAAFSMLLARYSRQDDVLIGTPVSGRQQTELEDILGLLLNTLVIRTRLNDGLTFAELLDQVRLTALDAYAHQDIPFDRVVDALNPPRDMSHSPVYQVQFMLQNAPPAATAPNGLELSAVEFEYGTSKFDLTLATAETEQGIAMEMEYAIDLFDAETIERMLLHFETLLIGIASGSGTQDSGLRAAQ